LLDPNTGIEYTAIAINFQNSSPVFGTVEGIAIVVVFLPIGGTLAVIDAR